MVSPELTMLSFMKLLHTIKNSIIVLLGGIGLSAACFGLFFLLFGSTSLDIIDLAYFLGGSIVFIICTWQFHGPLYILVPFSLAIAFWLGNLIERGTGHWGKPGWVFIFTLIILPLITLRLVTRYYQRQKQLDTQEVHAQPKSIFVNTLAKIFIVLGIVSISINILTTVILFFEDSPFLLDTLPYLIIGFFICVGILGISIGLLKRKNWARIIFIGGLLLGIVYFIITTGQEIYEILHPQPLSTIDIMYGVLLVRETLANHLFSIILYVTIIIILGWTIKKLISSNISKEFNQSSL